MSIKVGIFPGDFNPIHNGHFRAVEQVLKEKLVDEVWFLPNPEPESGGFHKNRLKALMKLETADIKCCNYRLQQGNNRETLSKCVMKILKEVRYSNCRFSLIIGSDSMGIYGLTYTLRMLLKELRFIVVPKADDPIDFDHVIFEDINFDHVCFLGMRKSAVSSTQIREKIACSSKVSHLIPEKVASLFEIHNAPKALS